MTASTDVFAAIQRGDYDGLKALLTSDQSLARATNQAGASALIMAVYVRRPELVGLLIEHGASVDLFAAAALGDHARLTALLGEQSHQIGGYSPDGWTALALAAHFNQVDSARLLLDHGADLQARSRNDNGNTPLHAALAGQSAQTAAMLLERGADVNAADANGWTPLHLAAASGDPDLVRLVLRHRPFVDPENRDGITPIALARSGGHTEVLDLLGPYSTADQR
jgi:ankyrin repeat protein